MNRKNEETIFDVTIEHREKEKKQTDMLKFAGSPQVCSVSVIDIVSSTKITSAISESKLGLFYSIFLNYVSDIVRNHGGIVVKNMGDSLLYYFTDNKYSQNTIPSSFDCNLDIIAKRDELNKKLLNEGLPKISYRISSDYGKVFVAASSISTINDIFGPTVNMCAKINHIGDPNTFFIGHDLYLHAKNLEEYDFEEISGSQLKILKHPYSTYFVKKNIF